MSTTNWLNTQYFKLKIIRKMNLWKKILHTLNKNSPQKVFHFNCRKYFSINNYVSCHLSQSDKASDAKGDTFNIAFGIASRKKERKKERSLVLEKNWNKNT